MPITGMVFIATSLDGYISRPDGDIDWLMAANARIPKGEDCGYSVFIKRIDAIVIGRNSFEKVLQFTDWPYGSTPVFVFSKTLQEIPGSLRNSVQIVRGDVAAVAEELSAAGFHHVYIDGGLTIQGFLAAGMVSEITITIIPVLLGSGRPLFGTLAKDVQLRLVRSRAYDFGFVQNTYLVERSA